MAINAFDVQEGMEVYTSDGENLGKISHIFSGAPLTTTDTGATGGSTFGSTPTTGYVPPPSARTGTVDDLEVETVSTGDTPGTTTGVPGPGSAGYTATPMTESVTQSAPAMSPGIAGAATMSALDTKYFEVHHGGVFGIGGESLYVPFSVIDAVTPGDCVTLQCTKDECTTLYSQKPASIDDQTA